MIFDLTPEERKAISALKRLAKKWPKSLWLFSASGTLWVMRCGEHGEEVFSGEGYDPDYIVESVDIQNAGGDW